MKMKKIRRKIKMNMSKKSSNQKAAATNVSAILKAQIKSPIRVVRRSKTPSLSMDLTKRTSSNSSKLSLRKRKMMKTCC